MKRVLGLILAVLIATPVLACDTMTAPYGVSTTVDFCLYITDATVGAIKVENASHASGDTYLMKDEGNEASTTNGFTDEGSCYSIVLTATEMQAARIILNIEDQGTKAWADKCVRILTYGNSSAHFGLNFEDRVLTAPTTCLGNTPTIGQTLAFLSAASRNQIKCTSSSCILYADDGTTPVCTFTNADSAGTFTSGEGT